MWKHFAYLVPQVPAVFQFDDVGSAERTNLFPKFMAVSKIRELMQKGGRQLAFFQCGRERGQKILLWTVVVVDLGASGLSAA